MKGNENYMNLEVQRKRKGKLRNRSVRNYNTVWKQQKLKLKKPTVKVEMIFTGIFSDTNKIFFFLFHV